MEAVVLDTNIVSYLMKGHTLAAQYRPDLEGKTLAISFMTVGELFEGAYRLNWSATKMDELKERLRSYIVVPYSPRISETWGRVRAERKSRTIAVDDAWIAATAIAHACPLITHNPGDFTGITDLKVITRLAT
jgi:predicted nucleic acid-binding protein